MPGFPSDPTSPEASLPPVSVHLLPSLCSRDVRRTFRFLVCLSLVYPFRHPFVYRTSLNHSHYPSVHAPFPAPQE